ncbi:bifunctional 3'-5' exonuclease/DNA polymerase [Agromyces sp. LHK192]|uniref:bifunctional 3'-5' exonuclease/DNA polymerase n=1 Tax=Agromyces sp. LHK192 TaxID=2498704 RepID=UPI001F0C14D0|nr:bifunctional 3'-5' exonuclease/DNA polymerase [Agromyces sp. LHK192]
MRIVLGAAGGARVKAVAVADDLAQPGPDAAVPESLGIVDRAELPAFVREHESSRPRWVWADTRDWYPELLAAGVRVERGHDLRLVAAVLEHSDFADDARAVAGPRPDWLGRGPAEDAAAREAAASRNPVPEPNRLALFDLVDHPLAAIAVDGGAPAAASGVDAAIDELARQDAVIAGSKAPSALRLLAAAESAGALIGVELRAAGLPWSVARHRRVLEEQLGPQPVAPGVKPARMAAVAAEVRAALDAPSLNVDSQVDLLRALRNAGLPVESTGKWEIMELRHPVVEPLLAYKRMSRLLSANGWAWIDEWIADGRLRAEYVPGGTATGRWATDGGGALQLPKQVRAAVVADPGWRLVIADAAQLEPRVLAGLARDEALADAGRGRDLYAGLVAGRLVDDRAQAKVAILGAIYGATTGDSGRLVPRLRRAYPRAMALVDRAAADGERGRRVTTLLGRSSPLPPATWWEVQSAAAQPEATHVDERRARSSARDWGRFTRNFVVQGSAAEWALCWMASLRTRLAAIGDESPARLTSSASGPVFGGSPHLAYFLHDELIVHTPEEHADRVADAVRETAAEAGRLLFGDFAVEFPLGLRIVDSYADDA